MVNSRLLLQAAERRLRIKLGRREFDGPAWAVLVAFGMVLTFAAWCVTHALAGTPIAARILVTLLR